MPILVRRQWRRLALYLQTHGPAQSDSLDPRGVRENPVASAKIGSILPTRLKGRPDPNLPNSNEWHHARHQQTGTQMGLR